LCRLIPTPWLGGVKPNGIKRRIFDHSLGALKFYSLFYIYAVKYPPIKVFKKIKPNIYWPAPPHYLNAENESPIIFSDKKLLAVSVVANSLFMWFDNIYD
jgi:hypothetical protein